MKSEWSLDVLYKGFDDKEYINDYKKLDKLTKNIVNFSESLKDNIDQEEALLQAIDYLEEFELLSSKLSSYVYLKQSTNTADKMAVNELTAIERQSSLAAKPKAVIKKFIAGIDQIDVYIKKHSKLQNYRYLLGDKKKQIIY